MTDPATEPPFNSDVDLDGATPPLRCIRCQQPCWATLRGRCWRCTPPTVTTEPPFNSTDDIPPGLTDDELDKVIAMRAAKRWADDLRVALGWADD